MIRSGLESRVRLPSPFPRSAGLHMFALNDQLGLVCPLHLPHEVLVQGHINKDLLSALSRFRCRAAASSARECQSVSARVPGAWGSWA